MTGDARVRDWELLMFVDELTRAEERGSDLGATRAAAALREYVDEVPPPVSCSVQFEEDGDDRVIRQAHPPDDEGCLNSLAVLSAVVGGLLAGAWKAVRR